MRILLDEMFDHRVASSLLGHEVMTVEQMGWSGLKNGQLLANAAGRFDVLLTMDRNLQHQQPVDRFDLAIVVLRAPTNKIEDILPLIPRVLSVLPAATRGQVTQVPGET